MRCRDGIPWAELLDRCAGMPRRSSPRPRAGSISEVRIFSSLSPPNCDAASKVPRSEIRHILYMSRAGDEATIRPLPARNVDYLSHDWEEEDIWLSWKYFASHRWEYRHSRRLENAMWRAWAKTKNKLKTVRP
jgi:hypothetical protein